MTKCPWCEKEVPVEEWSDHIDSHKDPEYDKKLIRESRRQHITPPQGIDKAELVSFSGCIAERLTVLPKPGEYPSGPTGYMARLLKRRMGLEQEIYDVLLGERSLDEFFSDATRTWDKEKQKVARIVSSCLKRLHGKETKELREEWEEYLRRLLWLL